MGRRFKGRDYWTSFSDRVEERRWKELLSWIFFGFFIFFVNAASHEANFFGSLSFFNSAHKVKFVEEVDFEKEVLQASGVVLVNIGDPELDSCRKQNEVLKSLAKDMKKVKFVKMNVDNLGKIKKKYGITEVPAFIIFVDGKKVKQWNGYTGKEIFKSRLDSAVKGAASS